MLCLAVSASASVFFVEEGSPVIHRDPFCEDIAPGDLPEKMTVVRFSSWDEIYASAEGYLPCQDCCPLYPFTQDDAETPECYYYNPEGGHMLHTDRNCPTVAAEFRPLQGVMDAVNGDIGGFTFCPICAGTSQAVHEFTLADFFLTQEQKAALLPGVWTLPSEQAISEEDALQVTRAYVRGRPEFMRYFSNGLFTCGVTHYDVGCASHPQETYKVLVTTVLRKPVGIVYVDAISAEVYVSFCRDD